MKKNLTLERSTALSHCLVDLFCDFCEQHQLKIVLEENSSVIFIKPSHKSSFPHEVSKQNLYDLHLFEGQKTLQKSCYISADEKWINEHKNLMNKLLIYLLENTNTVYQYEMIEYYLCYHIFNNHKDNLNLIEILNCIKKCHSEKKKIVVWSKFLKIFNSILLNNNVPQAWAKLNPHEIIEILKFEKPNTIHAIMKKACEDLNAQKELEKIEVKFNLITIIHSLLVSPSHLSQYEHLLDIKNYDQKKNQILFDSHDDIQIQKIILKQMDLNIFLNISYSRFSPLFKYIINYLNNEPEIKEKGLLNIEMYVMSSNFIFYIHSHQKSIFTGKDFIDICAEMLPNMLSCDDNILFAASHNEDVKVLKSIAQKSFLAWKLKKINNKSISNTFKKI